MSKYQKFPNRLGIPNLVVWNPRADGNCFFSAISKSLYPVIDLSTDQIRERVAYQVLAQSKEWFDIVMVVYQDEAKKRTGFSKSWAKDCTPEQLSEAILEPLRVPEAKRNYFKFQGDGPIQSLVANCIGVDVITLQDGVFGYSAIKKEGNTQSIVLLHDNVGKHYKSLGVMTGPNRCRTIFSNDDLPREITQLMESVDERGKFNQFVRKLTSVASPQSPPSSPPAPTGTSAVEVSPSAAPYSACVAYDGYDPRESKRGPVTRSTSRFGYR